MAKQTQHHPRVGTDKFPGVPCSCSAETISSPIGDVVVLRVRGQVDLTTLPALQAALDTGISRGPAYLLPDLSHTGLCTSPGVELLCHSAQRAHGQGIGFALTGVPPWLGRIWSERWGSDLPPCYLTPAAALTGFQNGVPSSMVTAPVRPSSCGRNRHRFVV